MTRPTHQPSLQQTPDRRPASLINLTNIRPLIQFFEYGSPSAQQALPPSCSQIKPSDSDWKATKPASRPVSGSTLISERSMAQDDSRPQSWTSQSSYEVAETVPPTGPSPPLPCLDAPVPARTRSLPSVKDDETFRAQDIPAIPTRGRRDPMTVRPYSLDTYGMKTEDSASPRRPAPVYGCGKKRPHSYPTFCHVADTEAAAVAAPVSIRKSVPKRNELVHHPRRASNVAPRPDRPRSPRLRGSLKRYSSLDNLMTYHERKANLKRNSSMLQRSASQHVVLESFPERVLSLGVSNNSKPTFVDVAPVVIGMENDTSSEPEQNDPVPARQNKFRHFAAEIGFCFTIAMTQFLGEYLISGFAAELPRLADSNVTAGSGSMGMFWPASLLTLILSATLLVFARLSDMYGGYLPFMFGVAWLGIWTLIPGFWSTTVILDVSRAMQGLAVAAFTPSTFAMVGSIYPEGPRRNVVLGLYSGCAPLGFFAGILAAGALPTHDSPWYFWIASALSLVAVVTAYLTVPSDRTDRQKLGLEMDWVGSLSTTAGLILVAYALAIEPYAGPVHAGRHQFDFVVVVGPLAAGVGCLAFAFWYEGWVAKCPLLPFDFFRPKSVKAFSLACLCFYASYGVWLYNSADFFQSNSGTTIQANGGGGISGMMLGIWYTPTAVGGLILCVVGGCVMHVVPIMVLLLLSALAWIAAPLILALAPLPLQYWSTVMPSMLCATLGIDLTYTVSLVFLSSIQPLRYQGLSGAFCSSLVNLAMSFSLPVSEIVMKKASDSSNPIRVAGPSAASLANRQTNWGYQAGFMYAAASAGVGLIICVLFVRISRSAVREQPPEDEERPRPTSLVSTLVDEERFGEGGKEKRWMASFMSR